MGSVFKQLSLASCAIFISQAALAADLAMDLPAPVIEHIPEVPATGGWYLRGDIGYKIYQAPKGSFSDPVIGDLRFNRNKMNDTVVIGAGIGYKFNDYLRSDLTFDYEPSAKYTGHAPCNDPCASPGYSRETSNIDVWTLMLNGYLDVGTWNGFTPYVGAGVGAAYVNVRDTKSFNPNGVNTSYDGSSGKWNFAWALMAGTSYAVTPNWDIDLGYRYKNLGEARSVQLNNVGTGQSRIKYKDLAAHEIRLGVRYNFDTAGPVNRPMLYSGNAVSARY
ncbi:outer membrane protein [Pannonibacter phragmitetus]|uniref:outer membrane protein n=1 Tax=Pannonibacter phragmitetus TaxID=121719 RepID=UPI000F450D65|nr:outer membrane protein [Pannonibacter phragmitetus]MBA4206017.1 porin family protein [Polymorphum sp.]